jgi:hypothetical protein
MRKTGESTAVGMPPSLETRSGGHYDDTNLSRKTFFEGCFAISGSGGDVTINQCVGALEKKADGTMTS